MARPRNSKRDEAFQIWKNSGGTKKLKDIAAELGLSDSQIRKWKNQDKWDDQLKGNVTKPKGNVTKRKRGAPAGNKNAEGSGPPKKNQNAVKHGFFSKFLPSETLEIMEQIQEHSPADMIWDQIQIQYAAIIRAQQIMFVSSQEDLTRELKREKQSSSDKSSSWEEEYELQFAWDKHATFLNAQSRAMSELRNLIKQFLEFAHENDERRLKLEQMSLNIEKTKAEIENIKGDKKDGADTWVDALKEVVNKRKKVKENE
ncbi:phage terminase small subunit [Bacillus sp. 03113]|uniref:phage terminase small subunit n=1 Tax=Bacillus sp. 03113 TaxID=2578211 RepID=UPI0011415DFD|nr:phage terminase small subunit [Bacillus sp. 03113]